MTRRKQVIEAFAPVPREATWSERLFSANQWEFAWKVSLFAAVVGSGYRMWTQNSEHQEKMAVFETREARLRGEIAVEHREIARERAALAAFVEGDSAILAAFDAETGVSVDTDFAKAAQEAEERAAQA